MIQFRKIEKSEPYKKLQDYYLSAIESTQESVEAILIASYSSKSNEVDARYVNLKAVDGNKFIFFSNYKSAKSFQFKSHPQISAVLFWPNINIQIRMRAKIKKTSNEYNQKYFFDRSEEKNALAISSNQSKKIDSYSEVIENFNRSLESNDLKKCPEYWGGYSFTPYYFEFWEGHESRINKRDVFDKIDGVWKHSFLQP